MLRRLARGPRRCSASTCRAGPATTVASYTGGRRPAQDRGPGANRSGRGGITHRARGALRWSWSLASGRAGGKRRVELTDGNPLARSARRTELAAIDDAGEDDGTVDGLEASPMTAATSRDAARRSMGKGSGRTLAEQDEPNGKKGPPERSMASRKHAVPNMSNEVLGRRYSVPARRSRTHATT